MNSSHFDILPVKPADAAEVSAVPGVIGKAEASSAGQAGEPAIAVGEKPRRVAALDFTKGVLVLIMVFYHWLNYFIGVGGFGYRYLRFLTPSFIFVTGFFVSHVYLRKYSLTDSGLPKRLLQRGLKLIAIFAVMNLVTARLAPRSSMAFSSWSPYLSGNSTEARVAFAVLLPIGYLLILSAGLVVLARFYKHVFFVACVLALLCALAFDVKGIANSNLELGTIGLLGVALGYIPLEKINRIVLHTYMLLFAYLGYLAAITIWRERFPLQVAGVCLSLAIIYAQGTREWGPERLRKIIDVLGRYSLLGYIVQIVILQVLKRGLPGISLTGGREAIALVAGLALTIASVELVDRARKKSALVNKCYSAVFA